MSSNQTILNTLFQKLISNAFFLFFFIVSPHFKCFCILCCVYIYSTTNRLKILTKTKTRIIRRILYHLASRTDQHGLLGWCTGYPARYFDLFKHPVFSQIPMINSRKCGRIPDIWPPDIQHSFLKLEIVNMPNKAGYPAKSVAGGSAMTCWLWFSSLPGAGTCFRLLGLLRQPEVYSLCGLLQRGHSHSLRPLLPRWLVSSKCEAKYPNPSLIPFHPLNSPLSSIPSILSPIFTSIYSFPSQLSPLYPPLTSLHSPLYSFPYLLCSHLSSLYPAPYYYLPLPQSPRT